jgi:low affinity Fe/Cu permease
MAKTKSKPKVVATPDRDDSARQETKTVTRTLAKEKRPLERNWNDVFADAACVIAHWMGKPIAFLIAAALVIVWAATGPLFNYSDTWQLVINTSTTIITFLMVFLIQNTQNRDTMALQLKLSELILAVGKAENRFAQAEDMSDQELERLHQELHEQAEETLGTLNARRARARKAG